MKKILFLIHDLGPGGAEKVLVNLVNNIDKEKFDITVMTLFDIGVNKQYLSPDVKYKTFLKKSFPGNSHIMKLLSPRRLHNLIIKDNYDIEIAYLEGSCARIISGCQNKGTKKLCWIHSTMHSPSDVSVAFRNYKEAINSYNAMNAIVFVSETVKCSFEKYCKTENIRIVKYNTNESEKILKLSKEPTSELYLNNDEFKIIGVGKITENKGFDRLIKIGKELLLDNIKVHIYLLGEGNQTESLKNLTKEMAMSDYVSFLGYKSNPYKYVAKCDLFVCSSYSEGFSTAATEALIVGTPVCTVDVSGMREMLGENNEYGIVTENNEQALYEGIKDLLDNPEKLAYYKRQAEKRGKDFSTEKTVQAVENLLLNLDGVNL